MDEKLKSINKKIENATIYLNEIDNHKKSIFEFWRFTSKDEKIGLNEGENIEQGEEHILKRVFDYAEDIEDVGIQMDNTNRQLLTKAEMDALFVSKTPIIEIINKIKNHVMIPENILLDVLEYLKTEADKKSALFSKEEYDIFGGLGQDKTQIKLLKGKKHRESKKDEIQVLNITKETNISEFKETLKQITGNIETADKKCKLYTDMTLYALKNNQQEYGYDWYNIQAKEALKNFGDENEIFITKINVEEQMPGIYDTNSLYYDNYNKTLPLGMDLSDKILINGDNFVWSFIKENKIYTNNYFNEDLDSGNYITKEIHIYEYKLQLKDRRT